MVVCPNFIINNLENLVSLGEIYSENGYLIKEFTDLLNNFPIEGYWITIYNREAIIKVREILHEENSYAAMYPISIYVPKEKNLDYLNQDGYLIYQYNPSGTHYGDYPKEKKRSDIISQIDFTFTPSDNRYGNISNSDDRYKIFSNLRNSPRDIIKKFILKGNVKKGKTIKGRSHYLYGEDLNLLWDDLDDDDQITITSLLPTDYLLGRALTYHS